MDTIELYDSEKDPEIKNVFDEVAMERDRQARGYGFEIGRGHALTKMIKPISDDNPFTNKNWRDSIIEEPDKNVFELNRAALDAEDEIEKAKTDDPFAGMKRAGKMKDLSPKPGWGNNSV